MGLAEDLSYGMPDNAMHFSHSCKFGPTLLTTFSPFSDSLGFQKNGMPQIVRE
jgi:hypothetical protein